MPKGVELLTDPATAISSIVPPTVHKVEEEVVAEEVEEAVEEAGEDVEAADRAKPAEAEGASEGER